MERQLLKRYVQRLVLVAALLVLGACASAPTEEPASGARIEAGAELLSGALARRPASPQPPPRDLWERIRRGLTLHTMHNARIGAARAHYLDQPRYLELLGPRAQLYLYFLVEEVEARGLPIELALLPLVESALNPFAVSGQRAAGLWQIMPGTADDLGVRRDWWFDGRLDLRTSTAVALEYLTGLQEDFEGDWLLALAAYNSGKYRVLRAQARNREAGLPTDFWSLSLPRETRRYVPRLIALSTLIAFDRALGLDLPPVPNRPAFEVVDTGGQIEMLRVAQLSGMDLRDLRRYNPGQLRWATAPDGDNSLLVPVDRAPRLREALQALSPADRVTWAHYRIRQGDSLLRIAKRFNTQIDLLRNVNNIRGNFIRAGDTMMIPNSTAWAQSLALAAEGETGVRRGYTVRSGDSLYVIARRFGVSIDQIISWNELDPKRYLQPGQALTLYLRGG